MAVKTIKMDELSQALKQEIDATAPKTRKAVKSALLQTIPVLVQKSPVDTGLYASSWDMTEDEKTLTLGNFSPHAAVIEYGARPFTPPIKPLLAWAKRVLKDPSQPPEYSPEVRQLAFGVQKKIAEQGMKPRKILENELPHIFERIKAELKRLG